MLLLLFVTLETSVTKTFAVDHKPRYSTPLSQHLLWPRVQRPCLASDSTRATAPVLHSRHHTKHHHFLPGYFWFCWCMMLVYFGNKTQVPVIAFKPANVGEFTLFLNHVKPTLLTTDPCSNTRRLRLNKYALKQKPRI